jgi:hypothetical protein
MLRVQQGGIMRSLICAFLAIVILLAGLVSSAQAGDSTNLYRNKSYTFSIVFPTGWQQRIGQTPNTVMVSENQQGDSIIIQVRPLPQNVTLDNFPDSKLRTVISDVFSELKRKFSDALMHDSGVTYICNEKSIWMRYTYSIKQAFVTRKITTQYYQVWHDGKLFGILCSASSERYAQVSSTLLNSVRSFIFEDPSWYRK